MKHKHKKLSDKEFQAAIKVIKKHLWDSYGYYSKGVIVIEATSHRTFAGFMDTAIHEWLHSIHPRWSEGRVKRATRELIHYGWTNKVD